MGQQHLENHGDNVNNSIATQDNTMTRLHSEVHDTWRQSNNTLPDSGNRDSGNQNTLHHLELYDSAASGAAGGASGSGRANEQIVREHEKDKHSGEVKDKDSVKTEAATPSDKVTTDTQGGQTDSTSSSGSGSGSSNADTSSGADTAAGSNRGLPSDGGSNQQFQLPKINLDNLNNFDPSNKDNCEVTQGQGHGGGQGGGHSGSGHGGGHSAPGG